MQIIRQKTITIQEQGEPFNFHIVSVENDLGCGLAPRPFLCPNIVTNPP